MRITAAVAGVALCSLAFAAPAMGETFHVDSLGDASDPTTNTFCDTDIGGTDGTPCTLRAALDEANATSAADIIVFDITGTHTIASPLTVTQETTIDGNGSGTDGTVIDGNDAVKLFSTNVSDVTFEDIRLEDGAQSSGGLGPAAVEFGGDGTLINTTVTSNQITGTGSATGGAISAPAGSTLSLSDSTVSANTITLTGDAYGAGIYTDGALELTDSTVDGNTISAGGVEQGGGIYAGAALDVDRSAITDNDSGGTGFGGGIFSQSTNPGTRSISNSTISGNTAGNGGAGGVRLATAAAIDGTTFADNTTTGVGADLVKAGMGSVTVANSIFASSTTDSCSEAGGTIDSAVPGNNVDIGETCDFGTGDGNQANTDPDLDPLAVTSPGTTATHALPPDSPALDAAGDCTSTLTTDQRGVTRAQGPACDAGAFELEYHTLTVTPAGNGSGTVTATGVNCPGDCAQGVPQGGTLVLTATPSVGSTIAWTNCDSPSLNQCTQTVGADETVTATFTLIPRTLNVSKAGTGSGTVMGTGVNCGSDCQEVLDHGTAVPLTATAAAGSTFTGWSGGGCSGTGVCNLTLSSDTLVTATFTANPSPPPPGGGGPITTTPKKKCKKGQKPKKGKCRKRKRKKK